MKRCRITRRRGVAGLQIYTTDNLVLATRTEDDASYLDVYVYDDGAGDPEGAEGAEGVEEAEEEPEDRLDADVKNGMMREDDVMLPSFPLCVERVNFRPGSTENTDVESSINIGNYAVVGTFEPQIELWKLDCVDAGTPICTVRKDPATNLPNIPVLGKVTSLEVNHKSTDIVKKGQTAAGVAMRLDNPSTAQPTWGRHVDETDNLYSLISRLLSTH